MRTIYTVLLAGLLGSTALAAAVPPAAVPASATPHAVQAASAPAGAPWLPVEAKAAAADPLAGLFPGQQVCTCIIGDHCCTVGGHQKCVPNSQPCP